MRPRSDRGPRRRLPGGHPHVPGCAADPVLRQRALQRGQQPPGPDQRSRADRDTHADCGRFTRFALTSWQTRGQAVCRAGDYPPGVKTIANQLDRQRARGSQRQTIVLPAVHCQLVPSVNHVAHQLGLTFCLGPKQKERSRDPTPGEQPQEVWRRVAVGTVIERQSDVAAGADPGQGRWHFAVDDTAGIVLAVLAVRLGRMTIYLHRFRA